MSAAKKKHALKTTRAKLHEHVFDALNVWRKSNRITSKGLMTDAIEYLASWSEGERPEDWHPEDTRSYEKTFVANLEEETRVLAQLHADDTDVPVTVWVSNALSLYGEHVGVQYDAPEMAPVVMLVHELEKPGYDLRVKLATELRDAMAVALATRLYESQGELLVDAFAWHLKQRERRGKYRYLTPPLEDFGGTLLRMPSTMHDKILEVSAQERVNKRTIIHNMLVDFISDHLKPSPFE